MLRISTAKTEPPPDEGWAEPLHFSEHPLAFVGSVVSETVASNYGLGNMMSSAQSQFNVPLVFAGLLMLAVEGIVMYAIMAWLEKRMTGWAHRSTMGQ